MTRHEIATLCCKVIALLMACQSAFFVVSGVLLMGTIVLSFPGSGWFNQYEFIKATILSVPAVTLAGMAYLCWKKAESISRRMVIDSGEKVTSMEINSNDLLTTGLTIAGVLVFVDGFRHMVGILYLFAEVRITLSELFWTPGFLSSLSTLVLASWLILAGKGIANAIQYLRTAGHFVDESNNANET